MRMRMEPHTMLHPTIPAVPAVIQAVPGNIPGNIHGNIRPITVHHPA